MTPLKARVLAILIACAFTLTGLWLQAIGVLSIQITKVPPPVEEPACGVAED